VANAKELERFYQDKVCAALGGETEVINPDRTRIDCLTDTLAIEFDFQGKYAECHSQAALYAAHTGKKPVCYLIVNLKKDRYIKRYNMINNYFHHRVELRTIPE